LTNVKAATDLFEKEMEGAGTPMMEKRYKFAADALASFGGGGAGGLGIMPSGGKGYGDKGVELAGNLGKYIKSLRVPQDIPWKEVSEHPWFGGIHGKHASPSYAGYHKSGRAIDIGGNWPDDQIPILKFVAEYNKKNNLTPVELFYGAPGHDPTGEHKSHVHVAYKKGGLVPGPTHALIGEKGREFVIDNDTTINSPPGFLDALNKANTKQNVMSVIQKYASYNQPYGGEPQIIEVPVPMPMQSGGGDGGAAAIIPMGGGVNSDMQFEDSLMYG
jgi:hypothetical protein